MRLRAWSPPVLRVPTVKSFRLCWNLRRLGAHYLLKGSGSRKCFLGLKENLRPYDFPALVLLPPHRPDAIGCLRLLRQDSHTKESNSSLQPAAPHTALPPLSRQAPPNPMPSPSHKTGFPVLHTPNCVLHQLPSYFRVNQCSLVLPTIEMDHVRLTVNPQRCELEAFHLLPQESPSQGA